MNKAIREEATGRWGLGEKDLDRAARGFEELLGRLGPLEDPIDFVNCLLIETSFFLGDWGAEPKMVGKFARRFAKAGVRNALGNKRNEESS